MSFEWKRRASESIHGGALTNSKRPECFVNGIYPTHMIRGEGCYLYDSSGRKYIDFICGLGSNLFGYANLPINQAISSQLFKGSLYSFSSTLEVECAERIKEKLHFISKLRFLKTGTEACMASIRIARAHTDRIKILSHGYHGWSDLFVNLTPPAYGIPKDENIEIYTNINQINDKVAAIILEPVITDYSESRLVELQNIIKKAHSVGALVIFDEIITGMRWKNFTFSNDTGIYPDIICLGKAFGGGLPISIVGTKPGIGENVDWFVSGTFAGELLSLAAMKKCIELLESNYKIDELWESGQSFINEFNLIQRDLIYIEGYPTRGIFKAKDDLTKALFFQEACKSGILFGPSFFYNFKHMEIKNIVLSACKDILQRIKHGHVKLEGQLPVTPFAQKQRG